MLRSKIVDYRRIFGINYFLTIIGGDGHGRNRMGGKYLFVGGYFRPDQLEGRESKSLDIWCDDNKLDYVTANTIEELVTNLLELEIKIKTQWKQEVIS